MKFKFLAAVLIILGLYVTWVFAWSRQSDTLDSVQVGVTSCHHCGMIVSDVRYAVSVLDKDEFGHTVTRHFDDPGCFLAFAKEHPQKNWTGVAHDFCSGREIPIENAQLVKMNGDTPMGSGSVFVQRGSSIACKN